MKKTQVVINLNDSLKNSLVHSALGGTLFCVLWWWRREVHPQCIWEKGWDQEEYIIIHYVQIKGVGGWHPPWQITSTPFIIFKTVLSDHHVLTGQVIEYRQACLKRKLARHKKFACTEVECGDVHVLRPFQVTTQ